jgi:hypothetical protein
MFIDHRFDCFSQSFSFFLLHFFGNSVTWLQSTLRIWPPFDHVWGGFTGGAY